MFKAKNQSENRPLIDIVAGGTIAIIVLAADNLSGLGIADDAAIPALVPIVWGSAYKLITG